MLVRQPLTGISQKSRPVVAMAPATIERRLLRAATRFNGLTDHGGSARARCGSAAPRLELHALRDDAQALVLAESAANSSDTGGLLGSCVRLPGIADGRFRQRRCATAGSRAQQRRDLGLTMVPRAVAKGGT
jgi:hypothetical protein